MVSVSNLKKLIETVAEYYNEVLNITLNEFISPNVMKIGEQKDQCELGRFLQLVLGKKNKIFFIFVGKILIKIVRCKVQN